MSDKTKDPMDKGMIRVLVYGTLKRGGSNHPLLSHANATFLGYDSITGAYRLYDLGAIPAVVGDSAVTKRIRGELYAVSSEGLASLDMLEGHPTLYRRRKVWTDVMHKRAWVYVLESTGFLGEDTKEAVGGLWHASPEESKYWLANKDAA